MNIKEKIHQIKFHREKLTVLQSEVAQIQSNCRHNWEKTKYDPEEIMEPTRFEYVGRGSDYWPEGRDYQAKKLDRWSRTCQFCLKVEYTKNTTFPDNIERVPRFG